MKQRKKVEWCRLDNASKIFPATCSYKDTKVFRLVCELTEVVDPAILQHALDVTVECFPLYKSVLKRGVFWYYLEASDIAPIVEIESEPVCAPIYIKGMRNLLFRVSYYNYRINVEIFHALSDGTGAVWFLKTLISNYLVLRYKDKFQDNIPELNYNASTSEKMDDSFTRYYTDRNVFKSKDKKTVTSAYHIRGTRVDENRIKVIEASMSAKAVLAEAHKYGTSLTIYITALFIYCIYKVMPANCQNRPVVLSVPINLRQYFESGTARNFFSTMDIGYNFSENSTALEDVIKSVSEDFQKKLTKEQLNKHLSRYMSLEKNPFARAVPLPFKDYLLRIAKRVMDSKVTAAISNLGRITMPSEFDEFIRQFSVYTSARRPQITMCTYGDRLVISFASPFVETEIQRTFIECLTKKGIIVEVSSNL